MTAVESLAQPLVVLAVLFAVAVYAAMLLSGALAQGQGHRVAVPVPAAGTAAGDQQVQQSTAASARSVSVPASAKPATAQSSREGTVRAVTPAGQPNAGQIGPANAGPDVVLSPGGPGLTTCGPRPCPREHL